MEVKLVQKCLTFAFKTFLSDVGLNIVAVQVLCAISDSKILEDSILPASTTVEVKNDTIVIEVFINLEVPINSGFLIHNTIQSIVTIEVNNYVDTSDSEDP